MEEKIYEKIKEDNKRSAQHYFKVLGMNDKIVSTVPNQNIDLMIILKNIGLIPEDSDKLDELNEFYDYLFKFGIDLGIGAGKKLSIEAIQNGEVDFEKFIEIDPEKFVDYNMEPTFISDLKEAILNEK